jgi:hypothetical protein
MGAVPALSGAVHPHPGRVDVMRRGVRIGVDDALRAAREFLAARAAR